MVGDIFKESVIAVIWDFDLTLSPDYMQKPILEHYCIEGVKFWYDVKKWANSFRQKGSRFSEELAYLNYFINLARDGVMPGLNNELLKKLGEKIAFYKGMPEFLGYLKSYVEDNPLYKQHNIKLENYIVSSGLKALIEGSAVMSFVAGVWGCEFIEERTQGKDIAVTTKKNKGKLSARGRTPLLEESIVSHVSYVIDNTTKTRAVFEINKDANKEPGRIDVNTPMHHEDRRIPFTHMVYIADGPSDVPLFSLINHFDGHTYGVYKPGSKRYYEQVYKLQEQQRIKGHGPADYTLGSQTPLWIEQTVDNIAHEILKKRARALEDRVPASLGHIITSDDSKLIEETTEVHN